jgi:hypothetical protein
MSLLGRYRDLLPASMEDWASIKRSATPNGLFHQGKRPQRPSYKGLEKSGLDAKLPQVADAVIRVED